VAAGVPRNLLYRPPVNVAINISCKLRRAGMDNGGPGIQAFKGTGRTPRIPLGRDWQTAGGWPVNRGNADTPSAPATRIRFHSSSRDSPFHPLAHHPCRRWRCTATKKPTAGTVIITHAATIMPQCTILSARALTSSWLMLPSGCGSAAQG
jgi:hypothetical protein